MIENKNKHNLKGYKKVYLEQMANFLDSVLKILLPAI